MGPNSRPSPNDQSLVTLFCHRVEADPQRTAMLVPRDKGFVPLVWEQLAADARRMAAALAGLGVRPGDRVIQVSENRYEWIVLDLAIHMVQGVHVAVHAALAGPQIFYQIIDSGAVLVVVSNAEQAGKLAPLGAGLPVHVKLSSHDPVSVRIAGRAFLSLPKLVAAASETDGLALQEVARKALRPESLATILYTSGTTGEPKGVMLSHGNFVSNALATQAALPTQRDDLRLGWLPLSHIFARLSDYYMWIAIGCQLALARGRDTILNDCKAVRPTLLNAVPYFYDKVYRGLREKKRDNEPGAVQELLGGRMRCCCSGGAALPDHVAEFFDRQGVPLVQGYGLTETSPVITIDQPEDKRIGTVGPPIPGVEVRIAEDGEVLTRGPHVMLGYWNKPEATAEVLQDGWFHTGDLGRMDDGRLRITGRKKELIVTAGGKNIAPAYLEALLTQDPLILQAMIVGDGRNYLTALIVPNPTTLRAEILRRRIPVRNAAQALASDKVKALYEECIRRRLAGVSHCEQVAKFTLLGRGFTIESGELTPTLKLRRAEVLRNCAGEIRSMYEE